MNYPAFEARLKAEGLKARRCSDLHWQILGGRRLVNVWPETKKGFRFQSFGKPACTGILQNAILEAGPPADAIDESVPFDYTITAGDKRRPSLGLIRRFWRWLW